MKYENSLSIVNKKIVFKLFISREHRRLDTVNMDSKRYNFKVSVSVADS